MTLKLLNYIGQLRLYSFLDLLIFATALTKDITIITGIGFLWLSFLLYLENKHQDKLRLKIYKYFWIFPFVISLFILPTRLCIEFALCSYFYANKILNRFWGGTAPVWRGLQNGIIAYTFNPQLALLAFILIFVRNFIADFRDAEYDFTKGIKTIPVQLGITKNQTWAFYTHLLFIFLTTTIWFHFSFLNSHIIVLILIILLQIMSYPFTPRASNPIYFSSGLDQEA